MSELHELVEKMTLKPVNLKELLSGEPPEQEWLAEPVLQARRFTGIAATRAAGKSLLALDVIANLTTGRPTLEQPAGTPITVIYIDQEMGPDDLYDRLTDLGWDTDNPLFDTLERNLHYYQLIDLPPLDTEQGGDALVEIVERHNPQLVVIDTVSRVTEGDENSADTFKAMWRHTSTRLKRREIAVLLLDHLGKDATKGTRGSIAKEDLLDVNWQLTETTGGGIQLKNTKSRQLGIPEYVTITRQQDNGVLKHTVPPVSIADWVIELANQIDQLGLPADASLNTVQKALKADNAGRRRTDVAKAVKFWKGRAMTEPNVGTAWEPVREPAPEPVGTVTQETLFDLGEHAGNRRGNHQGPSMGRSPPL